MCVSVCSVGRETESSFIVQTIEPNCSVRFPRFWLRWRGKMALHKIRYFCFHFMSLTLISAFNSIFRNTTRNDITITLLSIQFSVAAVQHIALWEQKWIEYAIKTEWTEWDEWNEWRKRVHTSRVPLPPPFQVLYLKYGFRFDSVVSLVPIFFSVSFLCFFGLLEASSTICFTLFYSSAGTKCEFDPQQEESGWKLNWDNIQLPHGIVWKGGKELKLGSDWVVHDGIQWKY